MSARDLAGAALLGAGGWLAWRALATTLPADPLQPPLALSWPFGDPFGSPASGPAPGDAAAAAPGDYQAITVARESAGNAMAKNPRSSASGEFQFTKATWQKVGGAWGPDPSKPFGGLTPSLDEQQARFDQLTRSNASGLARAGLAATNAALYVAHFLGLGTALRVLMAAPSTNLASLVGSKVMAANPQLRGFTQADFMRWAGA